jgi:hypothetical protein
MSVNPLELRPSRWFSRKPRMRDVLERPELADEVLAEYREAQVRIKTLGRATLGRKTRILIWALRIYVLFMLVVVAINIIQNI